MKFQPTLSFFWITPFLLCLSGYYCTYRLLCPATINMPPLIGQTIQQALVLLSQYNLNVRILNQQEDNDLPEGTILMQIPCQGQSIKPHQSVFLVVSKKKQFLLCPSFLQKSLTEIETISKEYDYKIKIYDLLYEQATHTCIAQHPKAGHPIDDKIIIYNAADTSPLVLVPSFLNRSVKDVKTFLEQEHMPYSIVHTEKNLQNHTCHDCVIVKQQPLPGSIINRKKRVTIQLYVQANKTA